MIDHPTYRQSYSILYHDVDTNNVIKPTALARLMQETAYRQMRDRKPTYDELFREGKSYVLIRYICQIPGVILPYDVVDVDTWSELGKGATFMRSHELSRNGEVVARAYAEWAVVNLETGRIYRTGEVDTENLEKGPSLKLTLPKRFRMPESVELKLCGNKKVRYTDCDKNLHMNNTNYQDVLWNMVPDAEHKRMTGFSFRFMTEAHNGADVEIYRAKSPEVIPDDSGGTESWYFRTMVGDNTNLEAIVNCTPCECYPVD